LAFMAFTNKNTGIVSGIEWVYMIIYMWLYIICIFIISGWWFGTWILFFHILGRVIPFD
jgi:hypothetical protein